MTTFTEPVVRRLGPDDPRAPLIVLLHGRGADEGSILGLAGQCRHHVRLSSRRSVRAHYPRVSVAGLKDGLVPPLIQSCLFNEVAVQPPIASVCTL